MTKEMISPKCKLNTATVLTKIILIISTNTISKGDNSKQAWVKPDIDK